MSEINSKLQAAVLEAAQKLSPDHEHDTATIAALIEKIDIEKVVSDMAELVANAGDDAKIEELLPNAAATFIEHTSEEDGEYIGILCALLFHVSEQLLFQDTNE